MSKEQKPMSMEAVENFFGMFGTNLQEIRDAYNAHWRKFGSPPESIVIPQKGTARVYGMRIHIDSNVRYLQTVGDKRTELLDHGAPEPDQPIEYCGACGATDFSIARDMIGTRKCKCGETWVFGPRKIK